MTVFDAASASNRSEFAARVNRIQPSQSGAAAQRVRELQAQGRTILNLTQGEPDFDTPDNVVQAALAAMKRGETKYTNTDGTAVLKETIAKKFARENGLSYKVSQISVANGAKQILFNALAATLDHGDEVIIPAPYWVSYPEMVSFFGGVPKIVACPAARNFKLDPIDLERAITSRTRWLLLNSPSNPTGAVYTRRELEPIIDVLRRNPHVWLLSDDIYEHLVYDGLEYCTPAAIDQSVAERTLVVNGVSKAYCMTGWRIGYAAGPAKLISQMAKLQSQATANPSSISQAAAVEALNGPQEGLRERAEKYQRRRNLVLEGLASVPGLACDKPSGAFYVFPSCRDLIGKRTPDGTVLADDKDFCKYLLDAEGVAVVHGAAYGLSPHFRISYATADETLKEACVRIARACSRLS
ncbi:MULTISPECIES: pyridoxal phosphate-dependent aminotransferase [Bradyrhizobium]|uniref:aspartate transaminase n=3 Tax=Bradyrhizobium TaxID=374 RepID=A0A410VJ99_9BRAD|nr:MULTISPECIES: pyridoxal phosphate-dependent aminotransferase [Bradyrhizobium]MCG2629333.1 pyridoxal phosphate-dependent aminotransferase [Bradyrhizobium zhengyangense]MCG2644614.1 pyridoxal phosphate-dependent aminotransferase [Bradyrhizobium zhengyangense]MCG2670847.1 pyridoxal phosphate-dependent aminotransferase [Bradyrhizobium zhengyangense]MDN4984480.1 pyridoxal phosphate-dependent aminotransferase [Bradyrhizobium sp. WYCCWR 13022]MDN5002472.1 pyridoxal phosphate-dependent aminotransfe